MKKNIPQKKESPKITMISNNKKAGFEYEILEKFEAGIELKGTEIKSLREGRVNLKESYILARNGTAKIIGMNISTYNFGNIFNHTPKRERRLLLHKKEILTLEHRSTQEGLTIIPLSIYIKGRLAKLSIALCKGKKLYDKRASLQAKDTQREIQRTLKTYRL
ncbi:MAG: SsrA-binding protein SmpB [Brevinema sp.]